MMDLHEAHYCSLQSQTNVYGIAEVEYPNGAHTILSASLQGTIISTEFLNAKPVSKEVIFTYIPADAEIVSIDAFRKSHHSSGIVVGITFTKPSDSEGKRLQYLNIYSECEPGAEFDLDKIGQACQNLDIDFVPLHLTHTLLPNEEPVFLLSGSDQCVHLFKAEDKYMHSFQEHLITDYFPEFADPFPSNVLWVDCLLYDEGRRRVSAVGCAGGEVAASVVDTTIGQMIGAWCAQHDSPITTVELFTHTSQLDVPGFVRDGPAWAMGGRDEAGSESTAAGMGPSEVHMLVTSAIEVATVYRSVLDRGLTEPLLLPESELYDAVTTATALDVDMDGEKEIIVGTYGQTVLAYKFSAMKPSPYSTVSSRKEFDDAAGLLGCGATATGSGELQYGEYRLLWRHNMPDPVLYVNGIDITGDGLSELLVLSQTGLHIFQHDLSAAARLLTHRLRRVASRSDEDEDDAFKQLLSENLSAVGSQSSGGSRSGSDGGSAGSRREKILVVEDNVVSAIVVSEEDGGGERKRVNDDQDAAADDDDE